MLEKKTTFVNAMQGLIYTEVVGFSEAEILSVLQ